MTDFGINEMLEMQRVLQDKYKHKWEPIEPKTGKNKLLWMVGKIGEVIDIVKKNGGTKASAEPELRVRLVEELADVLVYCRDMLDRLGLDEDEIVNAKMTKNEAKYPVEKARGRSDKYDRLKGN